MVTVCPKCSSRVASSVTFVLPRPLFHVWLPFVGNTADRALRRPCWMVYPHWSFSLFQRLPFVGAGVGNVVGVGATVGCVVGLGVGVGLGTGVFVGSVTGC